MFKEISAREIKDNLIEIISDEWMLVSSGNRDSYNMMTASWGFAGEMWGKDCAIAMIRSQRYTYEFMNKNDNFALSFYGSGGKDVIHKICGSKSGRDVDKAALTGLTPIFDCNTVYFEQARLVIICKKQYVQPMKKEFFTTGEPLRWYPAEDYHTMFIGEIQKVLIKE